MAEQREEVKPYYHVGSLEKGLRVLELVAAEGPLSVSEVAVHLGMQRSASHRLLRTLLDCGYVAQDEGSRYGLSLRLFELGNRNEGISEIRRAAAPYMLQLAEMFGETVNLGMWEDWSVVHIDKVESKEVLRSDSPVGERVSPHCIALGKAILAFRPPEEQERFLASAPFESKSPNTLITRESMEAELARVREEGVAIDNEELSIGLCCVAAPIFVHGPQARFAMSVSGPSLRLTEGVRGEIREAIKRVARTLSAELGGSVR